MLFRSVTTSSPAVSPVHVTSVHENFADFESMQQPVVRPVVDTARMDMLLVDDEGGAQWGDDDDGSFSI